MSEVINNLKVNMGFVKKAPPRNQCSNCVSCTCEDYNAGLYECRRNPDFTFEVLCTSLCDKHILNTKN